MNDVTITPRQAEILDLVAQGMTNEEIGERLEISAGSVRNTITRFYNAIDCPRAHSVCRVRLVLWWQQWNMPSEATHSTETNVKERT